MKPGLCGIKGVFASIGQAGVAIGGWVDAFSLRCGAPEDGCMLNRCCADRMTDARLIAAVPTG
ncbi:hypothetical protein ACQ0QQ_04765 [Lysinibacillus sphaericus]